MSKILNGIDWAAGIDFSSGQYAQFFNQLLADVYNTFKRDGYFLEATTSAPFTPATGSQTWVIDVDNTFLNSGIPVIITSQTYGTEDWCAGIITAITTTSIIVDVLVKKGTDTDSNWNISPIGVIETSAPGSTVMGQTGQTTAAAAAMALGLDDRSVCGARIAEDFYGASTPIQNGLAYLKNWQALLIGNSAFKANAAPYYPGDYASHPGVVALEIPAPSCSVTLQYQPGMGFREDRYPIAPGIEMDLIFKIPVAFTADEAAGVSCLLNAAPHIWGFRIGPGVNFAAGPMRLSFFEFKPSTYYNTDTGLDLVADRWYHVKVGYGYIYVFESEEVRPQDTSSSHRKKTVLAMTGITMHTTNRGSPSIACGRSGTGYSKKALLIDYFGLKPAGPLVR